MEGVTHGPARVLPREQIHGGTHRQTRERRSHNHDRKKNMLGFASEYQAHLLHDICVTLIHLRGQIVCYLQCLVLENYIFLHTFSA